MTGCLYFKSYGEKGREQSPNCSFTPQIKQLELRLANAGTTKASCLVVGASSASPKGQSQEVQLKPELFYVQSRLLTTRLHCFSLCVF